MPGADDNYQNSIALTKRRQIKGNMAIINACIAERQLQANANKLERVEELDLISRSQRGDTSAFDELVTRYRARILRLVYGIVNNEDDAGDIAQEAFLRSSAFSG